MSPHQALEKCHQDKTILASPAALLLLLQELAASQFEAGLERGKEIANQREDDQ